MKKGFMVLGGIFLAIILVIAGMGAFTWYKSSQYKDTAIPYIKTTVPELSKWDPELTKEYMVAEVLEETTDENFNKVLKYLSKLGKFISMEEPNFTNIYTGATIKGGKKTLVTYTINTVYENGNAVVTISLLDMGNSFQVYKFHINSMALVE